MAKQRMTQSTYMVTIYDDPDGNDAVRFIFVPRSTRQARAEREPPHPVPQYIVSVQRRGNETEFNWINPPPQEATQGELEGIARQRVTARHEWLEKLRK
jgi:hypothetical protein